MKPFWTEPSGEVQEQARAIVIGSGPGGALAALTLAEAGLDVLLVEEGTWCGEDQAPLTIAGAIPTLYQEGGFRTMGGNTPIPLAGGKALGGSSAVNSAISFRTPEEVLAEWNEVSDGAFSDQAAYYRTMDAVEACLQVAPTPDHLLSGLDRAQKDASTRLGWSNHNFRRNTPGCVGCGRCNSVCPVGGKRSVDRAFLPRAAAAGARIRCGVRVEQVGPGRVEALLVDRSGAPTGRWTGTAEIVVLSLGSVGTPRLILDSGIASQNNEVGRGLAIHPVFSVQGMVEDRVCVTPGATQGHYVDQFHNRRILLESNPAIPGATLQVLPVWGKELSWFLKRANHFASSGVMLRDTSRGRVHATRMGASHVVYDLDDADRARALEGMTAAAEMWFDGLGADAVIPNLYGSKVCRSIDEVRALLLPELEVARLMGYSSHPQASCAVGRVCDADGGLRGAPGIFVADASSLPNNVGRNPQISVMTVSRTLSERIARRLGAEPRPLWDGPGPVPPSVPQPGVPCGLTLATLPVLPPDQAPAVSPL